MNVDALLELVLDEAESSGAESAARRLDELCDAHPEQADTLRRRADLLRDLGVLTPPAHGGRQALGGRSADGSPTRLGPFRLLRRLGAGGMGVVHLAEQDGLGRRVAVKVIRPEQLFFPGAHERFRREVETVARLQHPGIVPIYTVGEADGLPYFAMEYVEGCSLADVLDEVRAHGPDAVHLTGRHLAEAVATCAARATAHASEPHASEPHASTATTPGSPRPPRPPRPPPSPRAAARRAAPTGDDDAWLYAGSWEDAVLRIVRLVAEALEHAHRRGVVHRDIKPSNVMLTHGAAGGQVKLLDFGLARSDQGASGVADSLTRAGSRLGSLPYMAPEQARGELAAVGPRTDVYALGATLHELLTLRRPFEQVGEAALVAAIERGDVPPARRRNPAVSWEAETVCLTAMETDPARRYASAGDLARDLHNAATRRPLDARRVGPVLRARRWTQRNPAAATALLLAAVLLVGVPLGFLVRERQTSAAIREQLQRADDHFARSLDAIDRMLTRVGAEELAYLPQVEPLRVALLEDAAELVQQTLEQEIDDRATRARAAAAHARLGSLQVRLGRLDDGRASLERSLALHEELVATADDPLAAAADRADVVAALAECTGLAGDIDGAEALHRAADDALRAALDAHGTADARDTADRDTDLARRRARNLIRLGELLNRRVGPGQSTLQAPGLAEWARAEALLQAVLDARPEDAAAHADLGDLLTETAQLLLRTQGPRGPRPREQELLDRADAAFARAAALDPQDPRITFGAHFAGMVRARALIAEGRYDEAEDTVRALLPGLERLAQDHPSTPTYRTELATALNELGILEDLRDRPAGMVVWYERALEELVVLAERHPLVAELQSRVAQAEMNTAVARMDLGEHERADAHYLAAIERQERAIGLAPGDPQFKARLRWHHQARSDNAVFRRRWSEAADAADALAAALPDDWESHSRAGSQVAKIVAVVEALRARGELDDPDGELTDALVARAVAHLRRSVELGFPYTPELRSAPPLDPLRGHEVFEAFLEDVDG